MRKRLDLIVLVGLLTLSFGVWSWGIKNDQSAMKQLSESKRRLESELTSYQEHLTSYLSGINGLYMATPIVDAKVFSQYVAKAIDQEKYKEIKLFSYTKIERDVKGKIVAAPVVAKIEGDGKVLPLQGEDWMNTPEMWMQVTNYLAINQSSMLVIRGDNNVSDSSDVEFVISTPHWVDGKLVGIISMVLSKAEVVKNLTRWIDPKIGWNFGVEGFGEVGKSELATSSNLLHDEIIRKMPGGETWKIELSEPNVPSMIWNAFLGIALIISFLFYAIVYGLTSAGVRGEALAAQITSDLQKYKLALDSTFSHVVITDPDGRVIYANRAVESTTGYASAEIMGKTPRVWGGLMSQDFYQKMWHQIKDERRVFRGEIQNIRKSGEKYIAKASISPIINQLAELIGFVGVEEDITEQKNHQIEIERQVLARTSELRAVIDSINRGLVVVSPEKEIILQNRVIRKIMEIDREIEYGELAQFVGHLVDFDAVFIEVLHQRHDVLAEPRLFGTRYLQVHAVPVVEGMTVTSVAIFIKDVTESVALQRSRDEFFSIASHELRTPLTAIRGNSEMIKDQYGKLIKQPEVLEMLDDIHTGSIRLIEIVNDFLNVSRLELGKIEYKIEQLDLKLVVLELLKDFEVAEGVKKSKITFEAMAKQFMVSADADRVKQILFNLIGNAVKFAKNRPITVRFETEQESVVVYVQDHGEGIAEDRQGLLFHKFQQAGDNLYTRDTSKGTGLGLYISRLMVEGMGGKIWLVESSIGKGSTFAFSLPIAKKLS